MSLANALNILRPSLPYYVTVATRHFQDFACVPFKLLTIESELPIATSTGSVENHK